MVAAAKKSGFSGEFVGVSARLVGDFEEGFSSCFGATLDLSCLSVWRGHEMATFLALIETKKVDQAARPAIWTSSASYLATGVDRCASLLNVYVAIDRCPT